MDDLTRFRLDDRIAEIPQELKHRRQWVCWRAKHEDGKTTKVPINPATGRQANTTDPATWGSFQDAYGGFCRDERLGGIGFVFTSADPYLGIDLDGVIEDGLIAPWAQELIDRLDTYAEISPSGTGLHLILRHPEASLDWKRKPGVEVYSEGRYFTVTGEAVSWDNRIAAAGEAFESWYASMRGGTGPAGKAAPATPATTTLTPEDEEIIRRAMTTGSFRDRYLDGYLGRDEDNDSKADLALLDQFVLAGATTPEQLDRLFRTSALCRDKWDREGYRAATIGKALDGSIVPGVDTRTEEERLRDEVRWLRERNGRLQELPARNAWMESTAASILRNRSLRRSRITACVLLKRFASMESRSEPWDFGAIKIESLAEDAGICRHTVRRHLEFLRDAGLIEYETVCRGTRVDHETGEMHQGRQTRIVPIGSAREFGERAAGFTRNGGKDNKRAVGGGPAGHAAHRPHGHVETSRVVALPSTPQAIPVVS